MQNVDITQRPTIGFIGLGNMGSGMARNLQENGYKLVITDLNRKPAELLLAGGAEWADTAADLARRSDIVITMLPTPKIVQAVLSGENGILAGLSSGKTWIDMSTSIPEIADGIRAEATERGIRVIDAPVSGMSVGAASGRLQIFVGANPFDFAELFPVFAAMGDPERIINVGDHGTGYAVKLMINQLWFSHLVATAEVLAIGTQAGVDLGVLRQALIASPASSHFLENDVRSILEHGDYDEGFAIALACKDLGLSIDLARSVGVSAELSSLVEQVFRRARRSYGDLAGEMTPFKLYEDLNGAELRLIPQL